MHENRPYKGRWVRDFHSCSAELQWKYKTNHILPDFKSRSNGKPLQRTDVVTREVTTFNSFSDAIRMWSVGRISLREAIQTGKALRGGIWKHVDSADVVDPVDAPN